MLEAGATLVIGTDRLTVDSTWVIDGGGAGRLVLQGATLGEVVRQIRQALPQEVPQERPQVMRALPLRCCPPH